jgi:hypothetical protein
VRPDQNGRFSIRGLPETRYLALAVDYLEPGEETDPERLGELRTKATQLNLGDGESRAIDLRVIELR